MKSELIYPCENCINRHDCGVQWCCQDWWDYVRLRKEELFGQKKSKRIKARLVKNPCNNFQLSTEYDCEMMGDFCKEKK